MMPKVDRQIDTLLSSNDREGAQISQKRKVAEVYEGITDSIGIEFGHGCAGWTALSVIVIRSHQTNRHQLQGYQISLSLSIWKV